MSEAKVDLVEAQGFTINFPSIGAPMTVRAEGDEIVILVRLTLRPRDNVMDINFDITTGGDRTTMSRFDKDSTPEVSRYWRSSIPST
jgi:hypothetical protein